MRLQWDCKSCIVVVQFEGVKFALMDGKSQMDGLFLYEDFVLGN